MDLKSPDLIQSLIPFLSLKDSFRLALGCANRKWIRQIQEPTNKTDGIIRLNSFWTILLRHQWRNIISNNPIPKLCKLYCWSPKQVREFYGVVYGLFYEAHPDGPGQSAVDVKGPDVPLIPLFFVPQLDEKETPRFRLLHMYSRIAYYVNQSKATKLILHSNIFKQDQFRYNPTFGHEWLKHVPSDMPFSFQLNLTFRSMFSITYCDLHYNVYGIGNRPRFQFARFLFDVLKHSDVLTIEIFFDPSIKTSAIENEIIADDLDWSNCAMFRFRSDSSSLYINFMDVK